MSTYLQGHHESVLRSHRWRTVENSAAYVAPHVREGMSVLDVGCGPGTITRELGELVGAPGSVVGVDTSADVLAAAAEECAAPNVRVVVGDALELPFPDGTFDVAHAHQVLQHLTDPVAALTEMGRVVRPGGLVAVRDADYAAMSWHPAVPGLESWREVYRAVARQHGGQPDAGRRLLSWARAAGFADVEPSASAWCFATVEDRSWWGGLQAERILESRIAEQAVVSSVADREQLHEVAAAWRTWASAEDGWFAVVHGEVLCRVPERRT